MILSIILMVISSLINYLHVTLFLFSAYYILSNISLHFINNSIKLNQLREKLKNKRRGL